MSFNTLILGDNETECLTHPPFFLPNLSSIFFPLIHLPIPLICHVIAYELPDPFLTSLTIPRFFSAFLPVSFFIAFVSKEGQKRGDKKQNLVQLMSECSHLFF